MSIKIKTAQMKVRVDDQLKDVDMLVGSSGGTGGSAYDDKELRDRIVAIENASTGSITKNIKDELSGIQTEQSKLSESITEISSDVKELYRLFENSVHYT